MRGFAALWVFIYHFWALQVAAPVVVSFFSLSLDISWCFTFGWLGVPIFFVLSGFLLAQPFVRQPDSPGTSKVSIRAYFIRRVFRVFPAYYFQLIALIVLAYFFQFGDYPRTAEGWFAHLTMTFFSPPFFTAGLNGAWWTLPIEFGFYLLLPMLAWRAQIVSQAANGWVADNRNTPTRDSIGSLHAYFAGHKLAVLAVHRSARDCLG